MATLRRDTGPFSVQNIQDWDKIRGSHPTEETEFASFWPEDKQKELVNLGFFSVSVLFIFVHDVCMN